MEVKMMERLKLALVGIGGMGDTHLSLLRRMEDEGRVKFEAVCDKFLDRYSANLRRYCFDSVRRYEDFDGLLHAGKGLDLIVICTPIHLHKSMACRALSAGYNILLEKPPAVTIQDIDEMIAVEEKSSGFCVVAFQHTAEQSFVYFKDQLTQGKIGRIQSISGQGIWRRSREYFNRTPWAGKLKVDGNYVLDGTVNNPFAHLLNNCLLLAGLNGSNEPDWVRAELYRANEIESEDTSCIKIMTKGKTEISFAATIAALDEETPFIRVDGSDGTAFWNYDGEIRFYNKNCAEPFETLTIKSDAEADMYHNVLNFISGKTDSVCCALKTTRSFVLCSNLAFESSCLTHKIDKKYLLKIGVGDTETTAVKDINKIINRAAKGNQLFSECNTEWSVSTQLVTSDGYKSFAL
jgi:predicted dehydrogenase